MPTYRVIGLMSGTSLDGLDIAYCTFTENKGSWSFKVLKAETLRYSPARENELRSMFDMNDRDLQRAHAEYGTFLGEAVKAFVKKHKLRPDFVASHGHTIFHQPEKGITFQAGAGDTLAAACGLTVICDFRSLDVKLGGQGAPLVPIGDELLFSKYDRCLNLGGFANVSYNKGKHRIAFDICPVNIVLNRLSISLGKKYDKGGAIARSGKLDERLLKALNAIPFYKKKAPKSLGAEWLEKEFMTVLARSRLPLRDKLRTVAEHAAIQIGKCAGGKGRLFITGGGAYNKFLLSRIKAHTKSRIVIPAAKIIEFKEAMIFAFLGVLRKREEVNCLASVTGARRDSSGGSIHLPQ